MQKLPAVCVGSPLWLLSRNPDSLVSFHASIYTDPLLKLQVVQAIIYTAETVGNSWCWRKISRVLAKLWHWDKAYSKCGDEKKNIPMGSNISNSCHVTDVFHLSGVLQHRANTFKACKQSFGQFTAPFVLKLHVLPHTYHQHTNILKHYSVM